MNRIQNRIIKPMLLPMHKPRAENSVVSPFMYVALCIYQKTYGKIPPIVIDIKLQDRHNFQFFPAKMSGGSLVWNLTVFLFIFSSCLASCYILAKKKLRKDEIELGILNTSILLGIVFCSIFLLITGWAFYVNRGTDVHQNILLENEMEFRKKNMNLSFVQNLGTITYVHVLF